MWFTPLVQNNHGCTLFHHFASSFDRMATRPEDEKKRESVVAPTRPSALLCLKDLIRLGADLEVVYRDWKKPVGKFIGSLGILRRALGQGWRSSWAMRRGLNPRRPQGGHILSIEPRI